MYHLKLQPSEIEGLDYYEYWYYIKDMTEVIKKQNKDSDAQQEQQQSNSANRPSMKMPNFKQPSFKMPRM